jgi:hypothetical protein
MASNVIIDFLVTKVTSVHWLLWLHEHLRSLPPCRHSLIVVVVVVVVVTMTMMMILNLKKKEADLISWQATDLYQSIIHICIQLFILHSANEKCLSSFQFILRKSYTTS